MLLRFSVENWMSFRDEATLDMVATREEQHSNHVVPIAKYGLKLLPVAAIYGANASGKSNLVKAFLFPKQFVTDPPKEPFTDPVRPFRSDRRIRSNARRYFRLKLIKSTFEYRFSIDPADQVVEENWSKSALYTEELLFRNRNRFKNTYCPQR